MGWGSFRNKFTKPVKKAGRSAKKTVKKTVKSIDRASSKLSIKNINKGIDHWQKQGEGFLDDVETIGKEANEIRKNPTGYMDKKKDDILDYAQDVFKGLGGPQKSSSISNTDSASKKVVASKAVEGKEDTDKDRSTTKETSLGGRKKKTGVSIKSENSGLGFAKKKKKTNNSALGV